MVHNLFPTPVGIYKLERDLTEKELSFIKGQETRPNMGNVTSVDNAILRNTEMTKLRDFLLKHLLRITSRPSTTPSTM
jgi:hypothetical protein